MNESHRAVVIREVAALAHELRNETPSRERSRVGETDLVSGPGWGGAGRGVRCVPDSSRKRSATWAALESAGLPTRAAHVADRCEKEGGCEGVGAVVDLRDDAVEEGSLVPEARLARAQLAEVLSAREMGRRGEGRRGKAGEGR